MSNQMQVQIDRTDYTALTEDAALVVRPDAGVLAVTGDDRHDFLHRMTTNHVNRLSVGQSLVNIVTSPVARIQFVFTIVAKEDALLLLPIEGPADELARHLRSQIFFMDNVQITDQSQDDIRLRYLGPNLDALKKHLTESGYDGNIGDLSDEEWSGRDNVLIIRQDNIDVPGFELLLPRSQQEQWIEGFTKAGTHLLTDMTAYHARRIELGRPWPGHELTDAYNPLEVGLGWACAEDKGCYTGQEIIARQITYDKVTKSLVGLRSGDQVLPQGTQLSANERTVGEVTSSIFSPALNAPIALAVVRRPHNEAGATLSAEGHAVSVVALPFTND